MVSFKGLTFAIKDENDTIYRNSHFFINHFSLGLTKDMYKNHYHWPHVSFLSFIFYRLRDILTKFNRQNHGSQFIDSFERVTGARL